MAQAAEAVIGHNQPPQEAASPFDIVKGEIESVREEVGHWLDGSEIKSEAEAEAVSKILEMARQATKAADEMRKVEAKPFDDGKKEVQARYKPLIEAGDRIAEVCKSTLARWLTKKEAERRERERIAREEAEAAERAAQQAFEQSGPSDLEAREEAERLAAIAKSANERANRVEREKTQAKGGARAVGLRTFYRAEITDATAFARWAWEHEREALLACLQGIADRQVRANFRGMPGVTVHEERRAV